jgi:hypothetical protein
MPGKELLVVCSKVFRSSAWMISTGALAVLISFVVRDNIDSFVASLSIDDLGACRALISSNGPTSVKF